MDVKTANGCLEDARALLTTSPGDAETRAREVPCQHFTSHQIHCWYCGARFTLACRGFANISQSWKYWRGNSCADFDCQSRDLNRVANKLTSQDQHCATLVHCDFDVRCSSLGDHGKRQSGVNQHLDRKIRGHIECQNCWFTDMCTGKMFVIWLGKLLKACQERTQIAQTGKLHWRARNSGLSEAPDLFVLGQNDVFFCHQVLCQIEKKGVQLRHCLNHMNHGTLVETWELSSKRDGHPLIT